MSCGVGCRRGSDTELLWLWCRPAATALVRPLVWEPPYAAGVAQEMAKRQKRQKKKKRNIQGVPIVAQHFKNLISIHEDVRMQAQFLALFSGLRIQCCCGCGIGWQLQLQFNPLLPGNFHMLQVLS